MTPALVLFALFYITPVVAGTVLSLFRWNGLESPIYVGFVNYRELFFDDRVFWSNVRLTVLVALVSLVTILPAALLLAACLTGRSRWMPVFRWLLFLPVVMPLSAAALLWAEIYNPIGGLANQLLDSVGVEPVAWLGNEDTALWALIAVMVWSAVGLHIVIQLSSLSAVPSDFKEAAALETSSSWRIFRHVILPLLREGLVVSATLIVTGSFTFFTSLAYIMTRGGPLRSTEVLGLRAYLTGFDERDFGESTAITVVMMLIAATLVAAVVSAGARNRVEY